MNINFFVENFEKDNVIELKNSQLFSFQNRRKLGINPGCSPRNSRHYYIKDHQGSIRITIDGTGNVVNVWIDIHSEVSGSPMPPSQQNVLTKWQMG